MTSDIQREKALAALLICLFAIVVIKTAWLCDDAYITFRTVDNLVNGYGLRWNVAERVQAYTNPLWMFLMSAVYVFTREAYYTSILLSLVVSVVAVTLFVRALSSSPMAALVGATVLIMSKAFMDYSTSGMENPLTHLLAALFLVVYVSESRTRRHPFALVILTALAAVNRLDTLLLFLPALGCSIWKAKTPGRLRVIIAGFSPLIAWELFSLFYYGFPFPNTAYAKLNAGVPRTELVQQGLSYLLNSLSLDPLTLLIIATAVAGALISRNRQCLAIAGGIVLYLLYVVMIGGDFMSGRFLTAPLFLALVLLCHSGLCPQGLASLIPLGLVVVVGLCSPSPPLLSGPDYQGKPWDEWEKKGIADNRGVHYQKTGLLMARRGVRMPQHELATMGVELRRRAQETGRLVVERKAVGMTGFYAGPHVHLIDVPALAEPLLARLPLRRPGWFSGHLRRVVPEGYRATIRSGLSMMPDGALAAYYEKLRIITDGGLLDPRRLIEVVKMNVGVYDHLVDRDSYAFPVQLSIGLSQLDQPMREGTPWDAANIHVVSSGAIEIILDEISHAHRIEASLRSGGFIYRLNYYLDERLVGEQDVPTLRYPPPEKLAVVLVNVPARVADTGYDRIKVAMLETTAWYEEKYSLGHLRLLE